MRKPKMTRVQISRLPRLLNMWYTPAWIQEEIGVSLDQIYQSYVKHGMPHKRDPEGHILINGLEFREWALRTFKRQPKFNLAEDEAYCFRCRKPVKIVQPAVRPTNRYIELVQGKCSECGAKVNRARARST
jgi:hypothetical protein